MISEEEIARYLKVKVEVKAQLEKGIYPTRRARLIDTILVGVHGSSEIRDWALAVAELMYERGRRDMQHEVLRVLT